SRIKHLLCQTRSACLNRRNTHSRGFYTIACLKNMGVIETARDIARQYLDKHSLGDGANDCTLTEGVHGKTTASPSEWSLAVYRTVAAPHKLAFHPADR